MPITTTLEGGFPNLTKWIPFNRGITASPAGAFDYFIMDYQQNLRMILTEETHSAVNTCTMETSRAAAEDPVFGQTGSGNEVETTRTAKPSGWTNNTTASVSQLGRLCGHYLGPNTLQKVMAGDQVSASVQYYYQSGETGTNPDIVTPLLSSLAVAIGGNATVGTLTHGSAPGITSNLNSTPGFVTAIEPNNNTTGTPQAYLTILFFDERFNFIAAADGGVAQQQVASSWTTSTPALALANIKAPKNGYAYAYISNRSDQSVYFDNLVVGVVAGNIIEEDHYYSFGLKIAAISSRKLGDAGEGNLQNNYQYQGSFSEMDADIGWNDFELRNYDAQTGRWVQQDPYDEFASPYSGMGNDPVLNTDPTGGCVLCETAEAAENLNQVVVIAYRASKTTVDMTHLAVSITSITVSAARISIDVINNVTTKQVGPGFPKIMGTTYPNTIHLSNVQIESNLNSLNVQGLSITYLNALVKEEGLSLSMYDVDNTLEKIKTAKGHGGNTTIGFGHLIHFGAIGSNQYDEDALTKENVFMSGKITVEEAFSLLSDDLKSRMPGLDNSLTENKISDIDDGVKGVFMDFIYNTGSATRVIGIFKKYGASGLFEEIKTGKIKSVNQSRKIMRLNLLRKAKMTDDFYKAVDDPMRINPTKNDLNVAFRFTKLSLNGNIDQDDKIEIIIITL